MYIKEDLLKDNKPTGKEKAKSKRIDRIRKMLKKASYLKIIKIKGGK